MDRVTWIEDFSLGIKYIDEQHQMLVAKLNSLIDASKAMDDAGDTEWLFIEFLRNCEHHFLEEESFLVRQGCSKMDVFARHHVEFGNSVEDLHRLSLLARNTVPVSLIIFLRQWLLEHLMGTEMKHFHSLMGDA